MVGMAITNLYFTHVLTFVSVVMIRLADAQDEIVKLRAKASLVDDLERQVRNLKDELYLSSSKKSYLDG